MDRHKQCEVTGRELDMAAELLLDYLFPNMPVTEEEKAAFEKAKTFQAEHMLSTDPELGDLKSLQIGHWRVERQNERRGSGGICPMARSVLLRAGLCYRGLEGRCLPLPEAPAAIQMPETPPEDPPLPPLRPGIQRHPRDKWPARPGKGNPPPRGIPPQGDPPLPGLPGKERERRDRTDGNM